MSEVSEISFPPFRPGTLIRYRDAPAGHVMRYLGWDPEQDKIAFLEIDSKKPPASRVPRLIPRSSLFPKRENSWEIAPESIIPRWMAEWDEEKCENYEDKQRRDEKYRQIRLALVDGGNNLLFNAELRNRLIKRAATESGVSEQWIRKLLTQFWFFGASKNGLLPRRPEQGAPKVPRIDVNTKKPGPPLSTVKLNPKTKLRGAHMTRKLHDQWEAFLIRRAEEIHSLKGQVGLVSQFSITELADEFLEIELKDIPPFRLPRRRRFVAFGRAIWRKNILTRYFANEDDWLAMMARLGEASDHTRTRLTIYELDGLLFNAQLLWGENSMNEAGVGKAVVMLCADVDTTAIVGVHVTVQNESSNAYRNCLFNAFSDKTELLETMGLRHLAPGFVHGSCDEARFDRGPGKARGLVNALINDMKVGVRFARARRGRDKSIVEAANKFIQEALKRLPGFYVRSRAGNDVDAKAHSERWARIQFDVFVELVLTFIHDWNTTRNVFDRLPEWMVKQGKWKGDAVTPKGLFDFLRAERLADTAIEWSPQATYARLIESVPLPVSEGRVCVNGAHYSSDRLKALWNQHVSTPSGRRDELSINVKKHPDTNQFVIWATDEGGLETLKIEGASKRRFGRNVWLVHHVRQTVKSASKYITEVQGRNAKLPGRMRQVIAAAHGLPKRPKCATGAKVANRSTKLDAERHDAELRAFKTFAVRPPENWSVIPESQMSRGYNPDDDQRFAGDI
ncbi:hypothetical protein OKW34_005518 [Paraburkholderia youngii]|uniref:hypothetical protein n=1 Tax=Paraburkholderia youngii TaxID=2782701 RepID=UPI003D1EAC18